MSHNITDSDSISFSRRSISYKHQPAVYKRRSYVRRQTPLSFSRLSKSGRYYKKKLALLLPAHNEELIIQSTLKSAIAAGQVKEDIYVVDDCSTDDTRKKAIELLGKDHVLTVRRSGKAMAVYQAIMYFEIENRYRWLHVADSDSVFGKDYFRIFRRNLTGNKHVAAIGFVQSLRGNWISKYRTFSYTYGQQIYRRLQSWVGAISVFPGPVTSIRTDMLKHLNFSADSLTEDFDLTLQFHRLKLGKIKYIPGAVNYTQDPQTLSDFCKQTARWHRGFFQGVRKYKLGMRPQAIDAYVGFQLFETLLFIAQIFVLLPLIVINTHPHRWQAIPTVFLANYLVITLIAMFSALAARRPSILSVLPAFYFMAMLELGIFVKSFVEVILLRKFQSQVVGWQTEGRRYKLNKYALRDTAQ